MHACEDSRLKIRACAKTYYITRCTNAPNLRHGGRRGRGTHVTRKGEFILDKDIRIRRLKPLYRISFWRAAMALGDHHGLDARSVCCLLGLEALTSTMGAAASRGTHVTRNCESIFEFELETVISFLGVLPRPWETTTVWKCAQYAVCSV